MRVIYHGRNLDDGVFLGDAGIHAGSIVHVSVSNRLAPPAATHHSRGNGRPNAQQAQGEEHEATGFDRLTEMGFSAEDIQQFRLQFYVHHLRNLPAGQTIPATQAAEMLRLENQWIDQTFNPAPREAPAAPQGDMEAGNTFVQPRTLQGGLDMAANFVILSESQGTGFNLLVGMMLGFLLGFIALFWIAESHLSRKTRLGMLVGIVGNLCFGFLAYTHS